MLKFILLVSVWICVQGRYYIPRYQRLSTFYDPYKIYHQDRRFYNDYKREADDEEAEETLGAENNDIGDYDSRKRAKLYKLVTDLLSYEKNKESAQNINEPDSESFRNSIQMRKFHNHESNKIESNVIENEVVSNHELRMPGVAPKEPDTYLCYAYKLPEEDRYITKFKPVADMRTAHHMLLFGCETPFKENKAWQCREMQPVCGSGVQTIKYAWGKNAPPLSMSKDVAFHVGGEAKTKYLVVQVHYLNVTKFKDGKTKDRSGVTFTMTNKRTTYFAGIYLLAAGWPPILPHKERFHMDMGCLYNNNMKFYPFRFRVHAHKLGAVITAYRVRDGKWSLIGRGDPQRPQAFYKVFNDLDIDDGDLVMGRCTFNSTSRNKTTYIGATHKDEMCNFYIMYFYDADRYGNIDQLPCTNINTKMKYPNDSDVTLAEVEKRNSLLLHLKQKVQYKQVKHWPVGGEEDGDVDKEKVKILGQVAGVDFIDAEKNIVFFHRGSLKWGQNTFDVNNVLNPQLQKSPIPENVLVWLDTKTGKFVKSNGANKFHVPHGVTVDHKNNIWLTDVGTHQVYKMSPDGTKFLLTLGEKFVNGNDKTHFCKPTDVAVLTTGEFFVSDGYCNSRVVKFGPKGNYLFEIGPEKLKSVKPSTMSIVHSLALDEKNNKLFVADRENKRVLVFDTRNGEFLSHISNQFDGPVYAIAFNPSEGGVLHAVNERYDGLTKKVSGFTYSLKNKIILSKWTPTKGFHHPHDLAVSTDNKNLVVSEIGPNKIWKFTTSSPLKEKKKKNHSRP